MLAQATAGLSLGGGQTMRKGQDQASGGETKRAILRITYFYLALSPLLAGLYFLNLYRDTLLLNVMVPTLIFVSDRDRWLVSTRKLRCVSFVGVEIGSILLTSLMALREIKTTEFLSQILTSTLVLALVIWIVLQPIGSKVFGLPNRRQRHDSTD